MPQDDTNTPEPETTEIVEEVETEVATPEAPETTVEEVPTEEAPADDINLQEYWQERYQAPAQSHNMVDEVAKEMSQLPTDQYGNVDEQVAAKWLAQKFSDVQTAAERRAVQVAERAVMGNLTEVSQQQQLLEKYPDLKRDRETLDTVFDLRDAAALRGQTLTLVEAANRLDRLRSQGRAEGTQSATRRTVVQAAAHLETASNKGSNAPQVARLDNKEDRQALLRQYVQKGIESGEIQVPGR